MRRLEAADNLQNWNRYTYVLNNPLSYTDPTGYFFKGLFKKLGRAIGKLFKAIGSAIKKVLASPIFRAIVQILGCAVSGPVGCAAIASSLAAAGVLAVGGSIGDALKAIAFSSASMGAFSFVGQFITPALQGALGAGSVALAAAKGVVHGVVGGALSAAQGGNFLEGFAASAIGAATGVLSDGAFGFAGDGDTAGIALRTAVAAAAGCAGAVLSGGKCGNGAITASLAHLFNAEGTRTPLEGGSGRLHGTDPRPQTLDPNVKRRLLVDLPVFAATSVAGGGDR